MPKAGPASVAFRNVSMRYGAVTAVDNVSFSIEAAAATSPLPRPAASALKNTNGSSLQW